MNTKMPALGAGLMIGLMALIAPLAMGHTGGDNEPSGTYVGPAGPFLFVNDNNNDTFAGNALCDLEVASDGNPATTQDAVADETVVDADSTTGGSVTDGTWDDGGFGAVCHTPDSHYLESTYNTQTCGYSGEEATATDDLLSPTVGPWLSTTCDYQTVVRNGETPTLGALVGSLVNCAANAVLTVNALEVVACVDTFVDCLLGSDVAMNGDGCPVDADDDVACGPDGNVDSQNSGSGAAGVPYPGHGTCDASEGVSVTFVWDAVVVGGTEQGVYVATTGHVL